MYEHNVYIGSCRFVPLLSQQSLLQSASSFCPDPGLFPLLLFCSFFLLVIFSSVQIPVLLVAENFGGNFISLCFISIWCREWAKLPGTIEIRVLKLPNPQIRFLNFVYFSLWRHYLFIYYYYRRLSFQFYEFGVIFDCFVKSVLVA